MGMDGGNDLFIYTGVGQGLLKDTLAILKETLALYVVMPDCPTLFFITHTTYEIA